MKGPAQIGLGLLLVGTLAGLWSAFNPSYFTIRKFGYREGTEEDRQDLERGFQMFALTGAAVVLGTYLVFYANAQ